MNRAIYAIPIAGALVALAFFVLPQQQAEAQTATANMVFLGNQVKVLKFYLDDGGTGLGYVYDIAAITKAVEQDRGVDITDVVVSFWGNATSPTPGNCISGSGCPQVLFYHVQFKTSANANYQILLIPAENVRILEHQPTQTGKL